ncbi:hypothetical protein BBJ29_008413 [Phytophthora kernoviae]|uniref:FYVE-type domain-containing protein n=1 Tax=Phytophthora kernoviae TaxID=325452 RepID=A0A3F2RDG1_9STRA|nr:hypothetical protein BBP00_00009155 [Phytophthora kernoviae]RLN60886.1 hypothetical protein BBJ29_008413 [Phytophthora kernoviae]
MVARVTPEFGAFGSPEVSSPGMRFPLPANTFPPLIVSEEDQFELQKLSKEVIHEALDQYDDFRDNGGMLDKTRWRPVKSREGVTAYRDLKMTNLEASRVAPHVKVGSGAITASTKLHGVLAVGTIEGKFNDMMFGLLNSTTEMVKIKSSYTNDKMVDAKVLATIVAPTPQEPAHGLYIKWGVSMGAPALFRKVVRPRDFVYLESLGILNSKPDDRIGYCLIHSLQIQSQLEIYAKGFVDAMGNIHPSIAVSAVADGLMSYDKMVHCGQMKKLNWLLKTKKTVLLDFENSNCVVCSKPAHRSKSCQVCMSTMCARCSVTKKLSFLSQLSRRVSQRSLVFCMRCNLAAFQADALEIASEELLRLNPFDFYEISEGSTSSSTPASPSSSIPPDATREFFG